MRSGIYAINLPPEHRTSRRSLTAGAPGWLPVVSDWDTVGRDGVGVRDSSTGKWYLRRNEPSPGAPEWDPFDYGLPGWWGGGGWW